AIIGTGADAIIGTGVQKAKRYSGDAIIGTALTAIDGTGVNAIIGTGADAIIGTGVQKTKRYSGDAIIGTGVNAIVGTGVDAIVGTGRGALLLKGPVERTDTTKGTVRVLGKELRIGGSGVESIARAISAGSAVEIAMRGNLTSD